MYTVFEDIEEGAQIVLYPNESNPLHSDPIKATYSAGYFYCDGSDPVDGPDYYFGDVAKYNCGYRVIN